MMGGTRTGDSSAYLVTLVVKHQQLLPPNRIPTVQVSDTTMLNSSTTAGFIIKNLY